MNDPHLVVYSLPVLQCRVQVLYCIVSEILCIEVINLTFGYDNREVSRKIDPLSFSL